MLETFRKLWKIKDLQKKVLYTFLMLLIYRLVGVIPAPGIDVSRLNESNNFMQLPLLNMMQMMTGNAFGQMTIMAMGITPYINASIIMQLLAVAFPSLQRMQEEEGGQEKMARITRYVTVGLAVFQAIGLSRAGGYVRSGWYNTVLVGLSMAGGSALQRPGDVDRRAYHRKRHRQRHQPADLRRYRLQPVQRHHWQHLHRGGKWHDDRLAVCPCYPADAGCHDLRRDLR